MVLLPTTYFFWHLSNFPASSGGTGRETVEWQWLGVMVVALAVLLAGHEIMVILRQRQPGWLPVLVMAACLLISVALIWSFRPIDERSLNVDRADWFWLIALIPLVFQLRLLFVGRLWTFSALDPWFVLLLFLCIMSTEFSPYASRGLGMLLRPLLGMLWVVYLVEAARSARSLDRLWFGIALLALLFGWMALQTTQWTDKSEDLRGIIARIPDFTSGFQVNSINPNEIAGALTWLIPPMFALMLLPARRPEVRLVSAFIFGLLLLALILGQSRFAVLGVVFGLAVMVLILYGGGRRLFMMGAIGLIIVLQIAITLDVFAPAVADDNTEQAIGLSSRDSRTFSQRFDIWASARQILADHPLTGVGMNAFRAQAVARDYPVVGFDVPDPNVPDSPLRPRPPHAHNEFIQIATDLGFPGLLVFAGIHLSALSMVWTVWLRGDRQAQILVLGAASGLLAHAIYGLGDAIPIWDRMNFIFWLLLGLIAAHYQQSVDQKNV